MSGFYSKITAPIAGGDPFGADVNYDLDYERLKGEMGKLGDINADIVESLSFKILTEKSKDVRVLAFFAYSMLRKSDFGRLADIFCALTAFCEDSFDKVYPRRDGAKAAALRWFSESRFSGQCENVTITAADVQHTVRLADAISKLRMAADKKFSDASPPLSLLHKRAVEWKKLAESAASSVAAAAEPSVNAENAKNTGNSGGERSRQKPVAVGDDEYQEILQCIKKIEAYITNLKHRMVV